MTKVCMRIACLRSLLRVSMPSFRRRLSFATFWFIVVSGCAFAQQVIVQDDNTDTSQARQRAKAQPRNDSKGLDGVEQDDPTARLEWQKRAFGIHTAESKKKLLRQRAARHSKNHRAGGATSDTGTPNINGDLSGMTFSADPAQAGSNPSDPTWVSIGPADAEYEQNGAASAKARDSGRARTILPHPT